MLRPLVLLLAVLAPLRARATELPAIEVPAAIVAGAGVDVGWRGLPPDVREVELELSLGGGRWVRISPEIDAGAGAYRWRVPALLAALAQIRLRAGGEGFERVVAISSCFTIRSDPSGRGRDDLTEWWHADRRAARPATGLATRAPSLGRLIETVPAETTPRIQPLPASASPTRGVEAERECAAISHPRSNAAARTAHSFLRL